MTLPSSGAMSTDQILTELRVANPGRAYPLNLTDADVLALAGKNGPPVTFPTDFYGKSSYIAMSGEIPSVSGAAANTSSYAYSLAVSISVQGGRAPFTYAWSRVSGDGNVQAVNKPSTSATFYRSPTDAPSQRYQSMVVQCVVTDATGATITRQGTVNADLG